MSPRRRDTRREPGERDCEKGPLALHPMPSGVLAAALSAELSQGRADAVKLPSTVPWTTPITFEVCLLVNTSHGTLGFEGSVVGFVNLRPPNERFV